MRQIINNIHYNNQKGFCILKFILFVVSLFYLFFIKIKNYLYKIKILNEKEVDAYVICVGNLTTGGVGKTPVVIEIANFLSKKGNRVGVISRGYKGKLKNDEPNIIKDFTKLIIDDPILTGDEPYMIAKNTDNVAIITCKDRYKAAKCAIEMGANYIVMDDGFSNRKLKKDLTLLLIDSKKQFGNGHVLPLGPLREPVSEIKRADKIIIINKDDAEYKKPIFDKESIKCDFIRDYYYDVKSKEKIECNKDQTVGAFCGIGQPEQFFNYVKKDFNLKNTYGFNDHHEYDANELLKMSQENNILVTTQKDEVKLENFKDNIDKMYVLKLKANLDLEKILDE